MSVKPQKDELVWTKLRNFPWWPGVVVSYEGAGVLVNFIGENSHATVPASKVCPYAENREKYAKGANAKLCKAIETADQILAGTITYQGIVLDHINA